MVDVDAVNLVREALKSGKSENEVVVLMKQAGYTDVAISETLAEAKRGIYPADELARRIAEKNNIPLQQSMPKLGPANLPSQPPLMQPMPVPVYGLDKSIIAMFKLSIDAFFHPADTFKKIKGGVSMGDGAKLIGLCGIAVALIISIFMLVGMLLLGSLASAVANIDMGTFFVSWIIITIAMLIVVPIAMLIGWIIGAGILWISAKVLGGTRSYSEFAAEMVFPQVGISLANMVVVIIEFIIMAVVAVNAVAAIVSAFTTGGSLGILSAFAAFAGTMMIGGIITGLISLVFGIYALYVLVVFIRESMGLGTLKAILAILLPGIIVAVLAVLAVGAFQWFSPLTFGSPTDNYGYGGGTTTQYAPTILMSYRNSTHDGCMSMDIRNSGGMTIPSDVIFEIKTIGGTATGKYVVIRSELRSGESGNFDIVSSPFDSSAKSSIPLGSYLLRISLLSSSGSDTSDAYFTC